MLASTGMPWYADFHGATGKDPPTMQNAFAEEELPVIDISDDVSRHSIVAEGAVDRYEGHPTTLLADDGKTMFCVWTTGHGGPCGQMARSDDAGRTWTRIDSILPSSYSQTNRNCPTLQKIVGPEGETRYFIFSAKVENQTPPLVNRGLGILVSENLGQTWREVPHAAHLSAMMPPTGFMRLADGRAALFGQVRLKQGVKTDNPADDQDVWMSLSEDGGFTWGPMRVVAHAQERNLCEPFCLRSPDGHSLALVMRENRHQGRSMMCFSHDEGATWTAPADTSWGLTGDRHEGVLLPDGRYVIAFRDRAISSSTYGQYMAWVGTWDDIVNARPGQYRIHLLRHYGLGRVFPGSDDDTGYSGVELLPDGTLVCTTYVRYFPDNRQSSVVSTRFRIEETDQVMKAKAGRG